MIIFRKDIESRPKLNLKYLKKKKMCTTLYVLVRFLDIPKKNIRETLHSILCSILTIIII